MQQPNTPGVPAPTFSYLDPSSGHIVHVAVIRDAAGKTTLTSQPMPTGFSVPGKDD